MIKRTHTVGIRRDMDQETPEHAMASKVIYERFLWFHDQVKAKAHPNSKKLAEKFEVSRKTAQRDIEFMRDRLGAPLVYSPLERGYEYEEKTYTLPGIWLP